MLNNIFFWITGILFCLISKAQNELTFQKAELFYTKNYFADAAIYYKKCIRKNQLNIHAMVKLALCYKKINKNSEAIRVFAYLQKKELLHDSLHKCFFECLKKCNNVKETQLFLKNISANGQFITFKEELDSIAKLKKYKKNVKLVNIAVNTQFSEICPVVHPHKGLLFLSNQEGIIIRKRVGATAQPSYNIYKSKISSSDSSKLGKSTLFSGKLNTKMQEGGICFSIDEKEVMYSRAYQEFDGSYQYKLYLSKKKNNNWTGLKQFAFNDSTASFTHPCLSADGTMFFFSSDMAGGFGGKDIYVCVKVDSAWSEPINLGSKINTAGNELFPHYTSQGNLYFSSNGHLTLGGYDIFKAVQNDGEWTHIENISVPLNTHCDEFSIYFINSQETKGYLSSNRIGTKGEEDLYWFEIKH